MVWLSMYEGWDVFVDGITWYNLFMFLFVYMQISKHTHIHRHKQTNTNTNTHPTAGITSLDVKGDLVVTSGYSESKGRRFTDLYAKVCVGVLREGCFHEGVIVHMGVVSMRVLLNKGKSWVCKTLFYMFTRSLSLFRTFTHTFTCTFTRTFLHTSAHMHTTFPLTLSPTR